MNREEVHVASATIRFPQTEMVKVSKHEARIYISAMHATKNPDFSKCATLGFSQKHQLPHSYARLRRDLNLQDNIDGERVGRITISIRVVARAMTTMVAN